MRRGGTYVSGLTSTAFIWSVARRRKTHELGWMPLPDTIVLAGVVGNCLWNSNVCDKARDGEVVDNVSYVGVQKVLSHASRQHGPNLNLTSPIAQKII
jgi:hypothetical protein